MTVSLAEKKLLANQDLSGVLLNAVMPLPQHIHHITTATDLVTTADVVRDGFLAQALEKTRQALPVAAEGRRFLDALAPLTRIEGVLQLERFREHLLAAVGFSEKALNHISVGDVNVAIERTLAEIIERAGDGWKVELASRYLLTKGDTLGGIMRNWTGAQAQAKLSGALVNALRHHGQDVVIDQATTGTGKIQGLTWPNRKLLFDKKTPLIGKSIDVILLSDSDGLSERRLLTEPRNYIACGELKGGIDPAGADEHWKTATSAFERIRLGLAPNQVRLFFVGAAIEQDMAEEIFNDLDNGRLHHAANLNYQLQLDDLVSWLVSL